MLATSARSAREDVAPSPIDGLIYRLISNAATAPHGGGLVYGCPDNQAVFGAANLEYGAGGDFEATTIQPSASGATASLTTVFMTLNSNGDPTLITAFL